MVTPPNAVPQQDSPVSVRLRVPMMPSAGSQASPVPIVSRSMVFRPDQDSSVTRVAWVVRDWAGAKVFPRSVQSCCA
jgi:hypothetical protein